MRKARLKAGAGSLSIRRDLNVTQMLLKSYGETFNLNPVRAEARVIFYYGMRSLPRPYSLIGTELNDHFGFAVYDLVEAANEYFHQKLHELLDRI